MMKSVDRLEKHEECCRHAALFLSPFMHTDAERNYAAKAARVRCGK